MVRVLLVLVFLLAGCESTLSSRLSEAEANRLVVTLEAQGVGATKQGNQGSGDNGFSVTVAPSDVSRALTILDQAGLPGTSEPGLEEIFDDTALVPTATEERAKYMAALGGELARSLEQVEGVLNARVHVALADTSAYQLDEPTPAPKASVLIKHSGGAPPLTDQQIRSVVSGAVQGMPADNVMVVQVRAKVDSKAIPLAHLGPIAVTAGSVGTLKLILGATFGLNILLVGLLALAMRRQRTAD